MADKTEQTLAAKESAKSFYHAEPEPSAPDQVDQEVGPVEWTASEYIHHEKTTTWYIFLIAGSVVVAGLVYLLTGDIFSAAMMVVIAAIFGYLAGKKPQVASYRIDSSGVTIRNKAYPWSSFKSFSVMEEGGVASIYLLPLQRFSPPTGMYFAPKDEPTIVGVISRYLPRVEREHDSIDKLMHRIRF